MDKKQNDFFNLGIAASFIWHSIWFFLLVPAGADMFASSHKSESVFLGSFLTDADFSVLKKVRPRGSDSALVFHDDLSRTKHIQKESNLIFKPDVVSDSPSLGIEKNNKISRRSAYEPVSDSISFDFSKSGDYFENIDFSDLKRMVSRQELASAVVFRIKVGFMGQVERVDVVTGSGDPALDLFMQRKIKNSLFRLPAASGSWINIKIFLKL